MNSTNQKSKKLWRSLADYENSPEFLQTLAKEFPSGAKELAVKPGMERRKFLELIGASMALAGVVSTGCIRRPKEYIYPENYRPENTLPGVTKSYATSATIASNVMGLSVTSTDGRPTKIDGNANHLNNNPLNDKLGSSNAFAQAEILNLYDSDRGQECRSHKKTTKKVDLLKHLYSVVKNSRDGNGIGVLVESIASPSYYNLLIQLKKIYPKILISEFNTLYNQNSTEGVSEILGQPAELYYDISNADVILSLDADFLGVEGDTVKHSREFSARRKKIDQERSMNRLYCVEANLSVTGANADHRYALNPSQIVDAMLHLTNELKKLGASIPDFLNTKQSNDLDPRLSRWVAAVARDLISHKGRALVMVGSKQPSWMHGLCVLINQALDALNQSVFIVSAQKPDWIQAPSDLVLAHQNKTIQKLVMIGGNPVYSMPVDLNFKSFVQEVSESFYLGYFNDDTAELVTHYIPKTHFLESWGDTLAKNGVYSIRQPLIAPLFDECINEYEFVEALFLDTPRENYKIVRDFCKEYTSIHTVKKSDVASFEDEWRVYLSRGMVDTIDFRIKKIPVLKTDLLAQGYKKFFEQNENQSEAPEINQINLVFALSNTVYDGRYANNAWLQELPDPVTKLVWDNALLINPKTAKKFKLSGNPQPGSSTVEMVTIEYSSRTLDVPVWVVPGIAEGTGVLHLGYGSHLGRISKKSGVDANQIRVSNKWSLTNVRIRKNGHTYSLVSTQEHGSMVGDPSHPDQRAPAVRTASLEEYKLNPSFVLKDEVLPVSEQKSWLFDYPKDESQSKWARQQWGMTIDLNSCIGCNACTVACQAENNISVVGKEQVFKSRVMNWIRIDRYFTGDLDDPELNTLFQPVNCQHCENAPCEAVCPVAATSHSPDGLNDMTYNRCVGTRYCANNCPYKVRRFNFFNYSEENDKNNPLYAMQKNPNVTVRFRGVMEKCTYCVQKINVAKNHANGNLIPDGAIVTACQSVCPTNAIVFGDVADPKSLVSQLKALPRNYGMLGELNTRPRTTYLAKIRNINPEIG